MSSILLSISGAGGSGQTTLQRGIAADHPSSQFLSITTRPPRRGEVDGRDYRFVTSETFGTFDDLLWHTTDPRSGIQYGARATDLSRALDATGLAVICVFVDFQAQIQAEIQNSYQRNLRFIHVHLLAPPENKQVRRLRKRGDDAKTIHRKTAAAQEIDNSARALAEKMQLHLIEPQSIHSTKQTVMGLL